MLNIRNTINNFDELRNHLKHKCVKSYSEILRTTENLNLLKPDYVLHEKNFWKTGIQKNEKVLTDLKNGLIEVNLEKQKQANNI